jgi:7,8-dihydro-6-hydroxymethylpterin-pyrophosphokinase
MRDRLFVLAPLADLAPGLVPPGWRASVDTARATEERLEGADAAEPIGSWRDHDGWVTSP